MNKKLILSITLCFIVGTMFAGKTRPMNIKLTVKGLENSKMILASYFGDNQYVTDTLLFDKNGTTYIPNVNRPDTILPGGVYLAVFPAMGNRYLEFILNETHFSIETDTNDLAGHIKITDSKENTLFYDDMKYLAKMKSLSDSLYKLYNNAPKDSKEKAGYRQQLTDLDKQIKAKRTDIINNNPDLYYAKLLKAMKDVDVPDAPRDANGKIIDSSYQWRYYKAHYWDNIDLKDERTLRNPVFHNKLKVFMNQTVVQVPDSINAAGDELLAKTDMKNQVYRYILTYIFNEMANSKVMGFDNSYVYFAKKYFCSGLTPWVDSVKLFKICDRANRLDPVLIGRQAQRLILPTDSTEMQWKSLYDIKAKYTIVAFWDPNCGHCKKEIPILHEAFEDLKKKGIDVQGYCPAIMEIENYKDWLEFIKKNNLGDWINVSDPKRHNNFRYEWDIQSTPQIYILDQNKVIKARRIGADQIEDYILHLENPSYHGKLSNKVSEHEDDQPEEQVK